jgi:hypothetical protein
LAGFALLHPGMDGVTAETGVRFFSLQLNTFLWRQRYLLAGNALLEGSILNINKKALGK